MGRKEKELSTGKMALAITSVQYTESGLLLCWGLVIQAGRCIELSNFLHPIHFENSTTIGAVDPLDSLCDFKSGLCACTSRGVGGNNLSI